MGGLGGVWKFWVLSSGVLLGDYWVLSGFLMEWVCSLRGSVWGFVVWGLISYRSQTVRWDYVHTPLRPIFSVPSARCRIQMLYVLVVMSVILSSLYM